MRVSWSATTRLKTTALLKKPDELMLMRGRSLVRVLLVIIFLLSFFGLRVTFLALHARAAARHPCILFFFLEYFLDPCTIPFHIRNTMMHFFFIFFSLLKSMTRRTRSNFPAFLFYVVFPSVLHVIISFGHLGTCVLAGFLTLVCWFLKASCVSGSNCRRVTSNLWFRVLVVAERLRGRGVGQDAGGWCGQ